jgi:hypothetical protein
MSKSVNILRGDLHLMVSAAFTRGRYVLMTAGDGQPQEITADLRERPDDQFGAEEVREALATGRESGTTFGRFHPCATDDHGPAIPAQTSRIETPFGAVEGVVTNADGSRGPVVYEFALQDIGRDGYFGIEAVGISDAPDRDAASSADWVHVYDRVTRERRTLKRPEPDAVLTGLKDVAASLRARLTP